MRWREDQAKTFIKFVFALRVERINGSICGWMARKQCQAITHHHHRLRQLTRRTPSTSLCRGLRLSGVEIYIQRERERAFGHWFVLILLGPRKCTHSVCVKIIWFCLAIWKMLPKLNPKFWAQIIFTPIFFSFYPIKCPVISSSY